MLQIKRNLFLSQSNLLTDHSVIPTGTTIIFPQFFW